MDFKKISGAANDVILDIDSFAKKNGESKVLQSIRNQLEFITKNAD